MYLEADIPAKLLKICQDVLSGDKVSFCFADRLFIVSNDDSSTVEEGKDWFANIGWTLVDWLPKDGATRHMGIARPLQYSDNGQTV